MLKDRLITIFLTAYFFFQILLLMGVMQFGNNTMKLISSMSEEKVNFWFSGLINYFPVIRIIFGVFFVILAAYLTVKRPSFFREKNLLTWISSALLILSIASGYIYSKTIEPIQNMNQILG